AHLSSTGAPSRCSCADCVPGLLFASHVEEPIDDSCAGPDTDGCDGEVGDYPNGGSLDSHAGWPLADVAAPYAAGERCSGLAGSAPDQTAFPASTAHQGDPDYRVTRADAALFVVKT